ncbi:hypothetical protein ACTXT7_002261 [Hymenolepis weldensis]
MKIIKHLSDVEAYKIKNHNYETHDGQVKSSGQNTGEREVNAYAVSVVPSDPGIDYISSLPRLIILHIMDYLSVKDLCTCSQKTGLREVNSGFPIFLFVKFSNNCECHDYARAQSCD